MTNLLNSILPYLVFLIGVVFFLIGVLLTIKARREVKLYRVNETTKRQLRQVIKNINHTLKAMDETRQSLRLISKTIHWKQSTDFIEEGGEQNT